MNTTIFGREPVLFMGVVNTAVALLAILWPERLPVELQAAIIALANAIVILIARGQVTPTSAPQLPSGTKVVVTDAQGDATATKTI